MRKRHSSNEPPRAAKPRPTAAKHARQARASGGGGAPSQDRKHAAARAPAEERLSDKDERTGVDRGSRKPGAAPPPSPTRRDEPRREARGGGGTKGSGAARHGGGGGATTQVYGFHAVRAALLAGRRRVVALFATEAAAAKLAPEVAAAGLTARLASAEDLTRRLGPTAVHQGVLLEAGPIEPIDLSEIVDASGIVLVLDQITDPHNVGAILRTAAAFGVDALVTTTRHAPEFSGVVAKAASGGLDHVPIAEVTNLARALETLGAMGYLRVGLDSEGAATLADGPLARPLALVLGAEDKGLRRLTRERCDVVARLDMPGPIKSLNVSNACAVALALTLPRLARGA